MKVALVYDRINKWGGAERVLLALHEIFPEAPLYTSVYNAALAPWAKKFKITTSFLQNFPSASAHHEMLATLMPVAFESFSFDDYDLVISITSEAAKGILTKAHTKHICICLTPTRYLWSGYDTYFSHKGFKEVAKPIVSYLRKWDKIAAQRPDAYVAISKEVQKRIKKYYGKDSFVIYPPLTLASKITDHTSNEGFFLVVSRLVPYKRVDIAIKACSQLGIPLKIVGSGSEEKYLRSIAGATVEFYKSLTDAELTTYYKKCSALLFPGIEDFGLTIIEAQSFGKPVVAYKAGGAIETVIAGKTGEFFSPQTAEALADTLQKLVEKGILETYSFPYNQAAQKNAKRFTEKAFKKNLLNFIKTQIER
jgi:glycosyltransferase involved in cell wall biosynthesis